MTAPSRVLVAGDWHGNRRWAVGVIEQLPTLLPDEPEPLILHAGDFGVWPGPAGATYLQAVHDALGDVGGRLWFVDGNHEDHHRLAQLVPAIGAQRVMQVPLTDRITWLPRGHRWKWADRIWLALGGATSVDRKARTEGINWWPQERISYRQGTDVMADGPADVMLTHDCPDGVPLNLPRPAPAWWELDEAEDHRGVLREITEEVQPSWLIHGHYHLPHETTVDMPWGLLRVAGLDQDGALRGNYRVLNVRDMTWETA